MRKMLLYLVMGAFGATLLVGCGNSNAENPNAVDDYNQAREAAWAFLNEKGWNDMAKENWQNAEVTLVVADGDYEFLDSSYEGEAVLAVSFEDQENLVVAPPVILIDDDTNKVVGYLPSE